MSKNHEQFNKDAKKARDKFDKVVKKHGKGTPESSKANKQLAADWAAARRKWLG